MTNSTYLDPLNQAVADQLAGQPPLEDSTTEEVRAFFEKIQQHDPAPGVTRTGISVPFEGGFEAFVFKADSVTRKDVPVIFYFHGGAWSVGSVNSYDGICRDLALQTGYAVVFPEYTLVPGARYPTQQEQCYATVKFVAEHGQEYDLSRSTFAVIGDSAGGQLAVATSILASTRSDGIKFSYQVLLSPPTDLITSDRGTPSEFKFFNGPFLTVPFQRESIDAYIPVLADRQSELASVRLITAEHAAKQPPTLVINSAVDVLRDDGIMFGEILQKAGVNCAIVVAHGQLHDSLVLEATRKGPTPTAVLKMIVAEIKSALG